MARVAKSSASFKLGGSRPENSGRKKGTPNKTTQKLAEILIEMNHDPARAILELLPQLEPKDRVVAEFKFMEYLYPKRRPEDVSGNPDNLPLLGAPQHTLEQVAEIIVLARGKK